MNDEFIVALKEIVKREGYKAQVFLSTIEDALVAAYKKELLKTRCNKSTCKCVHE